MSWLLAQMSDSVSCVAICAMRRMLCHMNATHGTPNPVATRGWTVDDSTFGARLALIRQRMRWNIKEAARECGVPAASWGTWEDGAAPRKLVDVSTLIAQRTGCDLGWLIAGPAMAGRVEVAGQVNGRFADIPRTAAVDTTPRRPAHRPTGAVSAGKRRPVTIRSSVGPMPATYAA